MLSFISSAKTCMENLTVCVRSIFAVKSNYLTVLGIKLQAEIIEITYWSRCGHIMLCGWSIHCSWQSDGFLISILWILQMLCKIFIVDFWNSWQVCLTVAFCLFNTLFVAFLGNVMLNYFHRIHQLRMFTQSIHSRQLSLDILQADFILHRQVNLKFLLIFVFINLKYLVGILS